MLQMARRPDPFLPAFIVVYVGLVNALASLFMHAPVPWHDSPPAERSAAVSLLAGVSWGLPERGGSSSSLGQESAQAPEPEVSPSDGTENCRPG